MKNLFKERKKIEVKDLDLAPMLSLMIAIIPVMLATMVMFKIRIFDSSVFPTSDKVAQSDGANESPITYLEIESTSVIKVTVKQADRNVFETDSSLADLNSVLKKLKSKYPSMKSLKIESSADVSYKDIIKVFDMAKSKESAEVENSESLFDDVTLEDIFKG
jgi:biopolymer transport protein ExbD